MACEFILGRCRTVNDERLPNSAGTKPDNRFVSKRKSVNLLKVTIFGGMFRERRLLESRRTVNLLELPKDEGIGP